MKFEKLGDDKIRITLNTQDLVEKHIDFHSFMSNSLESQNVFLEMLDEAEEKVGFDTKDYKVRIEALATSEGNFILTITRVSPQSEKDFIISKSKKVKFKRKKVDINTEQLVYSFLSFDDFCNFSTFISNNNYNFSTIAKNIILYTYNDKYYLLFSKINLNHKDIKKFYTLITEFGTYVNNSDLFARKLLERGNVIIKNNAIKTCSKYF